MRNHYVTYCYRFDNKPRYVLEVKATSEKDAIRIACEKLDITVFKVLGTLTSL